MIPVGLWDVRLAKKMMTTVDCLVANLFPVVGAALVWAWLRSNQDNQLAAFNAYICTGSSRTGLADSPFWADVFTSLKPASLKSLLKVVSSLDCHE